MQLTNELEERPIRRDPRAVALMLVASLTVMTAATISPALPGLETQFAGDETYSFLIRLLVAARSLAVVLFAPWCGVIADRASRRSMLLAGLILFIISGSAGLFLPTLPLIMASRLCLGIALAMIMTAQSALLGDYFSGKTLHIVTSAQVSARNLGGFVFIMIAGLLATMGPRFPFAVYALPILVMPFFWRVIVDPLSSMPAEQNLSSINDRQDPAAYISACSWSNGRDHAVLRHAHAIALLFIRARLFIARHDRGCAGDAHAGGRSGGSLLSASSRGDWLCWQLGLRLWSDGYGFCDPL